MTAYTASSQLTSRLASRVWASAMVNCALPSTLTPAGTACTAGKPSPPVKAGARASPALPPATKESGMSGGGGSAAGVGGEHRPAADGAGLPMLEAVAKPGREAKGAARPDADAVLPAVPARG